MRRAILVWALFLTVLGLACSSQLSKSASPRSGDSDLPEYIGEATMKADRTIVLYLRAESADGAVGHGTITYAPDDPRYEGLLRHIGGLEPGQKKPVRPWPDE